ncbi:DUF1499 domain-containing protein [Algirhabdus cladophorae]|uniref:DUF1499 domain-containing protein n=1 Tax=Algirhabdus cladophorae TaxID=3377108 RepID=UPI003B84B356
MKRIMWIIGTLVILAVALAAYARLAPISVTDWHVAPEVAGEETLAGSYKTQVAMEGPVNEAQAQIKAIALATPRTKVLAEDDGLITFITRSAGFGFPDFTTVAFETSGDQVTAKFYARLKIGKADMGVNKARVQSWLAQLSDN